jgi:hypothetical protein
MKIAMAQMILRHLHEKQAGIMLPLIAGAGLAAAAHGTRKALDKSREYHAGFNPNFVPGGHG